MADLEGKDTDRSEGIRILGGVMTYTSAITKLGVRYLTEEEMEEQE